MKTFTFAVDKRRNDDVVKQFKDALKRHLILEEILPGTALTPVEETAKTFKLTVDVVEESYQTLVKEGYLAREANTYVTQPFMLSQDFYTEAFSIYDAIIKAGKTPRFETNDIQKVTDLPSFLSPNDLKHARQYLYLKRTYYADDMALAILHFYYDAAYFKGLSDKELRQTLTYEHFKHHHDIQMTTPKRIFEVVTPTKDISEALNQPDNVPIFRVIESTFDQHGIERQIGYAYVSMNYRLEYNVTL